MQSLATFVSLTQRLKAMALSLANNTAVQMTAGMAMLLAVIAPLVLPVALYFYTDKVLTEEELVSRPFILGISLGASLVFAPMLILFLWARFFPKDDLGN
jgi:hypothetical protein